MLFTLKKLTALLQDRGDGAARVSLRRIGRHFVGPAAHCAFMRSISTRLQRLSLHVKALAEVLEDLWIMFAVMCLIPQLPH